MADIQSTSAAQALQSNFFDRGRPAAEREDEARNNQRAEAISAETSTENNIEEAQAASEIAATARAQENDSDSNTIRADIERNEEARTPTRGREVDVVV